MLCLSFSFTESLAYWFKKSWWLYSIIHLIEAALDQSLGGYTWTFICLRQHQTMMMMVLLAVYSNQYYLTGFRSNHWVGDDKVHHQGFPSMFIFVYFVTFTLIEILESRKPPQMLLLPEIIHKLTLQSFERNSFSTIFSLS